MGLRVITQTEVIFFYFRVGEIIILYYIETHIIFRFSCDFQGIQSDMAQDYCWIHGSAYIPVKYQVNMKLIN
jgi:hypothetical protein